MKITKRMKKILLFLLHPEKVVRRYDADTIGGWPYGRIMSECERKERFQHSEVVSYLRTFRILENLGFIARERVFLNYSRTFCFSLTAEGRKRAEIIEKEIQDFINEYKDLLVLYARI